MRNLVALRDHRLSWGELVSDNGDSGSEVVEVSFSSNGAVLHLITDACAVIAVSVNEKKVWLHGILCLLSI